MVCGGGVCALPNKSRLSGEFGSSLQAVGFPATWRVTEAEKTGSCVLMGLFPNWRRRFGKENESATLNISGVALIGFANMRPRVSNVKFIDINSALEMFP